MAKKVTFILSAEVAGEATSGLLLGEFNNWNYNDGIKLEKQKDGSLKAIASLDGGKRYEYRYLLNDGRWVNDQSAETYVHISGLHVENCVITVPHETTETKKTEIKEVAPKAAPIAAKPKAPVKKAAPVKEKIVEEKVVDPKAAAPKTAVKTEKAKTTKPPTKKS